MQDRDGAPEFLAIVFPTSEATIHDNWQVGGLRGTGSNDLVAVAVVTRAFRAGGGSALYESSILPRCLRDINAAAQHLMVSDIAYELHGKMVLGLPDIDPMS